MRTTNEWFAEYGYLGQWRSPAVPVDPDLSSLDEAIAKFHEQHEIEYTYRRDGRTRTLGTDVHDDDARFDPQELESGLLPVRAITCFG